MGRPLNTGIFLLYFGIAIGLSALEPDAVLEHFGREEGLTSSSVTVVAQDEQGFLWFATQGGLNRWDGYRMKVWQQEPFEKNTISHNLVQTMFMDREGVIWLGTYGGLNRFDTKSGLFKSYSRISGKLDSLSHNVVVSIHRDMIGRLWVGTLDGLNLLNEETGTFEVFRNQKNNPRSLSGSTIRSIQEDDQGRLWIGTTGGLNLWDDRERVFHRAEDLFPGALPKETAVMTILDSSSGEGLWLGLWGKGLALLNPKDGRSKLYPLSDNRIYSVMRGEGGQLYVATWGGGLIVFDPKTGSSFALRHDPNRSSSLSFDIVFGTFLDRSGILWIATNGGGLDRYNPRKKQFRHISPDSVSRPSLPEGRITVIKTDSKQRVWAGVYNAGLALIDPVQGIKKVFRTVDGDSTSLSSQIVNDVTEDAKGRLWFSTADGVNLFDEQHGNFKRFFINPKDSFGLAENMINGMAIDDQGWFWVGTSKQGLLRLPPLDQGGASKAFRSVQNKQNSLPSDYVYFVKRDSKNHLWVGTNGGLALYQPATDDFRTWIYDPDDTTSLPGNSVRVFFEDSQGRLWVGTNGGGLARLDLKTGTFRHWGRSQGLQDLSVFGIQEDQRGVLWLTTADGLFSFQPDKEQFRRFGTEDGLLSAEFSADICRLASGDLYLGSLKGITYFRPGRYQTSSLPPSVVLTNIQVLNHPREMTKELNLSWWENTITLEFSALDFISSNKNQYAYKLEGFDRDWIYSGNRNFASYTNLNPGTYTFRFKGANSDDLWAESSSSLIVNVEAEPWLSWYAFFLYFLVAGTVVYLYQKARLGRRLRQKVHELETVRGQLEEANQRLDQLSRLDGLTGIPNRRALDSWLEGEWARSLRQKQSLAVLMLDIDFFKRYNDFYGHLEGDSCLKAVAGILQRSLHRTTDFCARYGGEEFVVVLHDTDSEGASHVAQRVLESVDALAIPHQMSTAAPVVTVSIGVASQIPNPDTPASEMIQKADKALYRAKALGRHRIETDLD